MERPGGGEGVRVLVRLQPRAKRTEIVGERNGALVVRVTAAPVDGRANRALCELIAKRAGISRRSVHVERGRSARDKVVRVEGVTSSALRQSLAPETL